MKNSAHPATFLRRSLAVRSILRPSRLQCQEHQNDHDQAGLHERGLNSKRCKSCQTLYQSAMNRVCATLLLMVVATSPVCGKNRHCMLRIHAQANPADTEVFSMSVRAKLSGKEVAIERVARITEGDVQAFYPYPLGKGQFGVLFQLDDHGRIAL